MNIYSIAAYKEAPMLKLALLIGLALLSACGASHDEDYTPQESEDTILAGEYCDRYGAAFCSRMTACTDEVTYTKCFSDFKLGCCGDSRSCADTLDEASRRRVERCEEAMPSHACEGTLAGEVPATCMAQ